MDKMQPLEWQHFEIHSVISHVYLWEWVWKIECLKNKWYSMKFFLCSQVTNQKWTKKKVKKKSKKRRRRRATTNWIINRFTHHFKNFHASSLQFITIFTLIAAKKIVMMNSMKEAKMYTSPVKTLEKKNKKGIDLMNTNDAKKIKKGNFQRRFT